MDARKRWGCRKTGRLASRRADIDWRRGRRDRPQTGNLPSLSRKDGQGFYSSCVVSTSHPLLRAHGSQPAASGLSPPTGWLLPVAWPVASVDSFRGQTTSETVFLPSRRPSVCIRRSVAPRRFPRLSSRSNKVFPPLPRPRRTADMLSSGPVKPSVPPATVVPPQGSSCPYA